jgi:hypothetical protein
MKSLEKNTGETHHGIGLDNYYWDMTSKAQAS